jgi:hypothetical protein
MTMNKIDFRKNGTQVVNMGFDGEQTITYVGKCPVTGIRLYESTGSNDPRGPLGVHAITVFVASGYNMTGPDVLSSWIACNNNKNIYNRVLDYAKSKWEVN